MRRKTGMTLVELLIVLAILVLLMAVTAPLVRGVFGDRKVRETSRILNTFIVGAQARAAESGRPAGILIERVSAESSTGNASAQHVYAVAVPAPYSGDIVGARAGVENINGEWFLSFPQPGSAAMLTESELLLAVGDSFKIKFDYRGRTYQGARTQNGLRVDFPGGPPPGTDISVSPDGLPFQIYRPPTQQLMASPTALPTGMVIDLDYSGASATGREFSPQVISGSNPAPVLDYRSVIITFRPDGALDEVLYGQYDSSTDTVYLQAVPALGPIHLLTGSNELVGEPGAESNLQDQSNFWVSISRRGRVTTAENAGGADVAEARQFARSSQTAGGG